MRKLTTEEFIEKARKVHGDKYDYSLVKYKNSQTKVKIICEEHGDFLQKPNSHLNGHGCDKCARKYVSNLKVKNNEQFIKDAINIHGNKYVYFNDYVRSNIKIKILCPKHGEFLQTPNNHLNGAGCPKCSNKYNYTTTEFIELANKKHKNKYTYPDSYINNKLKIRIICPIHGVFVQKADSHLNGKGCSKCHNDKKKTLYNKPIYQFIDEANNIHNNYYTYKSDYVNTETKIQIICPNHGEFTQTPHAHLSGQGCPKCKQSKGEIKIIKWLNNIGIKYEVQKKFKDCIDKRELPFDFYLPDYNICIEFDGIQHFKIIEFFDGEEGFKNRQNKDKIKTEYCKNNNIKLIRIKYNDNINDILKRSIII